MTQINIILAYLPLDSLYLLINILNKIDIYLLYNNLSFVVLFLSSFFPFYLFASRAGQRIIEGAISGIIAGALIETGKQILNSPNNSKNNTNNNSDNKNNSKDKPNKPDTNTNNNNLVKK